MQLYKTGAPFFEDFDTQSAFDFYESVAHRLPKAEFPKAARKASGLLEIASEFDAFVFDAFGVLNVGNTPIGGAVETVTTLRSMGKQLRIITNAATFPKPQAIAKFKRLGFDFLDHEIFTSRMAAEAAILEKPYKDKLWGVMARSDFQASDLDAPSMLLENSIAEYDAAEAFLLLSTWEWTSKQQLLLEESLSKKLRPIVVANPDVIAPLEEQFSTEAGFVAHKLADLLGAQIEFHGKPFPSVFKLVEKSLPSIADRKKICMIGDTLHTDVLGGAASGWSSSLVADHGLFRNHDVSGYIEKSAIVPDWIVPSI